MVRRVSLDPYHPLDGGDNYTGALDGGEAERMGVMNELQSILAALMLIPCLCGIGAGLIRHKIVEVLWATNCLIWVLISMMKG